MVIQTLGLTHTGAIWGATPKHLGSRLPHPTPHPIPSPKLVPKYVFCHIAKANANAQFERLSSLIIPNHLVPWFVGGRWINHSNPPHSQFESRACDWVLSHTTPTNPLPWGLTFKTTKRDRYIPFGWRSQRATSPMSFLEALFLQDHLVWCNLFGVVYGVQ